MTAERKLYEALETIARNNHLTLDVGGRIFIPVVERPATQLEVDIRLLRDPR